MHIHTTTLSRVIFRFVMSLLEGSVMVQQLAFLEGLLSINQHL